MKNHTLPSRVIPLSLLISAALAVPTLSIAMPSDSADSGAMNMQVEPTQEDMQSATMNQPTIDSDNAAAVDDIAPRDPEMQAYNQPYNDQNAQPTMDPSNDLNSSDSSSILSSNPNYQTADANSPDISNPDINRTYINNPDINNPQVDSLAKAEAEMLNPEMQAYDQPYNNQNAQPTMDPSDELNSSDSSSVLNSNPSYQTADANSPDINRTDINNPDVNNPQVDSLAKAEAEMLNPEMQAQSELSAPNPQSGNIDSQPLIAGESATDNTIEVASTLQEKKKDSRGELLATQPAELEISEARYLVSTSSRSNSLPNGQTL